MPTTTFNFRIGANIQTGDRLFTEANVENGVVIAKTSQDNAICPPMPSTTPPPWNPYLTGSTTLNDYRLHGRWEPHMSTALPTHNTTTGRWEFGKHDDVNAAFQGLRTTYNVNIQQFDSRYEVHDSPWDTIGPYLPGGCFALYDSMYNYDQLEPGIDPANSEYARYFCGFFDSVSPVCAFWMYHLTTNYEVSVNNQLPTDFRFTAPSPPICIAPKYFLYRAMGFKFGDQIFRSPVFVSSGRFEIEVNWTTNTWTGRIYDSSGALVYIAAHQVVVPNTMRWAAYHRRTGMLVGQQFEGAGLEWTIYGRYTPWISQWNVQSTLYQPWRFIDLISGLDPAKQHQLRIVNDSWMNPPQFRARTGSVWTSWQSMTLAAGKWQTPQLVNIDAIEYRIDASPVPVEMIVGERDETTSDPPPSGGGGNPDLVVNADVRMPLVARCRNIARITVTRVSGEGVCRIVITSPSNQETAYQYTHNQLPVTIEFPVTETGLWRVRVYDGDGTNLRFDRYYDVRAGNARSIEVEYKRRAIGFTACHPIEGIPDNTSQLEEGQFVLESGIDDASWK